MSTDQISLKKGPLVNIRVKSSSGEIGFFLISFHFFLILFQTLRTSSISFLIYFPFKKEYGYLMARPDGYYAPNAYDPEETLTASAFTFRLWKKYVHIKGQLREVFPLWHTSFFFPDHSESSLISLLFSPFSF